MLVEDLREVLRHFDGDEVVLFQTKEYGLDELQEVGMKMVSKFNPKEAKDYNSDFGEYGGDVRFLEEQVKAMILEAW